MKTLTVIQPWASLIAWREKHYETRSWSTPYRGPLAIHAGLSQDEWEVVMLNSYYREAFEKHGARFDDLPFGCVLCVADLVACPKTEDVVERIGSWERDFGDYSSGRYAWQLENVRVMAEPIPARGFQGIWTWDRTLESLAFKAAA